MIQFLGEGDQACKWCQFALRRQKQTNGNYEQFYAQCPGATWAQVFLGADKNGYQISKEVGTRRLGNVIAAFPSVPKELLTVARREGALLVQWDPLCLLEPEPTGAFTLKWSERVLQKWNINKEQATIEFTRLSSEALTGRRAISARLAQAEWCS